MPTAPQFEWPQGEPLFETQLRAVTESLAGNGVVSSGDLALSAGTANREIDYAAGTVYYIATEYDETAGSVTVSAGDANYDRWDTVAYDTAAPGVVVHEGTPAANPEPPDVSGDEVLLGVVYVPQNFDDVFTADQILNWQGRVSNEAEEVHYGDSTGAYGVNNVDAALDKLQEAAQISAYPLSIGTDTEASQYPLANSDLANSTITVNAGTGLATTNAGIGLGGSATLSIPSGGVSLTELASPFALQDITDGDLGTGDLTAESGGFKVFDNTADHVPRPQVDDRKATTILTSSTFTTSDEEAVLVDTATIAATSTVTLASADAAAGNTIRITDLTGEANNYSIAIDTEGSETIDGSSSYTITSPYASVVLMSDGTNWAIISGQGAGARGPPDEDFSGAETGQVAASSQGVLVVSSVAPGEVAEVYRAVLTTDTVEAVASGVDLKLVTFDNAGGYSTQATLAAGDGATVYDDVTGSPIASYENTGTAAESIGVIVDNTLTNAVDIVAITEGRTGL